MMKKNGLLIATLLLVILTTFWTWISFGNSDKTRLFLQREEGNISEIFFQKTPVPLPKSSDIKTTQVKDLYEFRRYLFILPKAFIFASSIEEVDNVLLSFPKVCRPYYNSYPQWLDSLGFLKSLFAGQGILKCYQIGSNPDVEKR